MAVSLLDPARYRRMPWKNGGGTTTEIALQELPGEAGRFLWRVSIADVAEAGPFSAFAGYERLIAVVEGAGMRLTVDGAPATVTNRAAPFRFSGDAAVDCALLDGPIRDFNLIFDRERADARLDILPADKVADIPAGGVALVHALDGEVILRTGDSVAQVSPGWTARLDDTAATLETGPGACAVLARVATRG